MKGKIPSNINLDELFKGFNGSPTIIKNLKNGTVYILSKISFSSYDMYKRKDGYIHLNTKNLESIIGQKRPTIIFKILTDNDIIEVSNYSVGHKSKGYRLTEKYNTGHFSKYEYSKLINKKLKRFFKNQKIIGNDELNYTENDEKEITDYQYLFDQFSKNKLRVDTVDSDEFLKSILFFLLSKSSKIRNQKRETILNILNYIGRIRSIIDDINNENYFYNISESNNRFNSNLTSLNKFIRPFLRINDEKICETDISSSQPYILSTILNEDFTNNTNFGYNLHTIFPEMFVMMKNSKKSVPTNTGYRNHFILGVYFNDHSLEDLQNFINFDFNSDDFYISIVSNEKLTENELIQEREKIKKNVMNYLFESNENYRFDSKVIKKIKRKYPSLTEYIEEFNQWFTNSTFSYLLQRTESHLVLEKVCGEINEKHPEIPFFTIHDSIITTINNKEIVNQIMTNTIENITGKKQKTSIKEYNESIEVTDKLLNDTWKKLKIKNTSKYDKLKYSILSKHVQGGYNLIDDVNARVNIQSILNVDYL